MDNQLNLQKSLANEDSNLTYQISQKRMLLGKLTKEVEEITYKLDNLKKSYKDEIRTLSTTASNLRTYNINSDYLSRQKKEKFDLLKESIGKLEEQYNSAKLEFISYRTKEIAIVDEEVEAKRAKLKKEIEQVREDKKNVVKQLYILNKNQTAHKEAMKYTAIMQNTLKMDYEKLQRVIKILDLKTTTLNLLMQKINSIYLHADEVLKERNVLLQEEVYRKNLREEKLANIKKLEDILTKKIVAQEAEISIKEKALSEKEEQQRIKQVQLDVREKSLQALFDKLHGVNGAII